MKNQNPKEILTQFFDQVINQSNELLLDKMLHPSFKSYGLSPQPLDNVGFKKMVRSMRDAFPDLHVNSELIIESGEYAVGRGYWKGTHTAEFLGISATGKRVIVNFIDVWKIKDGKAYENRVIMDLLGLTEQLGVVNAPTIELDFYHN